MPFLAPLITAISAAAASIGTFIAGLGILGQTLVVAGLNIAVGLMRKKKKGADNSNQVGGTKIDKEYGENISRQVAMGLCGIAGHDCYVNTYGAANKFFQQIFILSDYYTSGFSRLAINGEWVSLGDIGSEKGLVVTSGDFADLIFVKYFNGRQTTADSYLINSANPFERWTAQHIGVGVSYVIISMTYDQERNNAEPQFFFEFQGAPLYDWRFDSTSGGSGTQRFLDTTTHVFSENPVVQEYNYRRGLAVNGDIFCGMNMPAADLPLSKWTIAANICDEIPSGATEKRYVCSVIVDCNDTHGNNIETMALSCGSMNIEGVEGTWPLVGSDQPVVLTITDDDLISTAAVQYRAKRSMGELVNSVSGNFVDPAQIWASIGYEPQVSAAYIAIDRRTRDLAIDFPQVRSARQAAQLASIYLYENRYEAVATITLRPRFVVLEVGDWIRWDSEEYGDKTYIITGSTIAPLESEDGPRNIMISLQERNGTIYDAVSPPAIIVPYPPGAPQWLSEITGLELAAVTVEGDTGVQQAAIQASWDFIEDVTVTGVAFRWYPVAQPSSVFTKIAGANSSTVTLLSEGVVGSTEYAVETKLITDPERETVWSAPEFILTSDVATDIYGPIIDALKDQVGWLNMSSRSALEGVFAAFDADLEFANIAYRDKQELRRESSASFGEFSASFGEQIEVAVTETAAVAGLVQNLTAAMGGNSAQINVRWAAYAGLDGYLARFGLQAATNVDGITRAASMFMDVPSNPADPSRISFLADQFVISNGLDYASPFVFAGGVAYLNNVKATTLSALSATLGAVNIENAIIGNLQVGTSNIAPGAVTEYAVGTEPGQVNALNSTYVTVKTITLVHGLGSPIVEVLASSRYGVNSDASLMNFRLMSITDGAELYSTVNFAAGAGVSSRAPITVAALHNPPSGRSSTTYGLQIAAASGTCAAVNTYIRAFAYKR